MTRFPIPVLALAVLFSAVPVRAHIDANAKALAQLDDDVGPYASKTTSAS